MDSPFKISVIIPTYNEEANIERCLKSIFDASYDHGKLDVFVVDAFSTDRTVELAKRFPVTVLYNKRKDPEVAKMIGLRQSSGDLFMYLDADITLASKDWFTRMTAPLVEDARLCGTFTRFLPDRADPAINRFLCYTGDAQLTPLLNFLCANVNRTIIGNSNGYSIVKESNGINTAFGVRLYRRKVLVDGGILSLDKFLDIEIPLMLSEQGFNLYGYLPEVGLHHRTVKSLSGLLRKRIKYLENVYFETVDARQTKYIDAHKRADILKLMAFFFYSNLLVPATIKGSYKSMKYRDLACMYEPIVSLLETDLVAACFLLNAKGRNIIKEGIFNLFRLK